MKSISTQSQFSFEELAFEVNSVVEDLRWLHLELSLRNRFNEILIQNIDSIDAFLELALADLRSKLGLLEVSVYIRERGSIITTFQDFDTDVFWKNEPTPWNDEVMKTFRTPRTEEELKRTTVFHYTADSNPLTAVLIPLAVEKELFAVVLLIVRSSAIIPRIRHIATSLSVPLSVSIDYIVNVQKLRVHSRELETRVGERTAELEWTHNFLVRLVDSSSIVIVACDQRGNIIIWNKAAENITDLSRSNIQTIDDFFKAFDLTPEKNKSMYEKLKKQFISDCTLPDFEISFQTKQHQQKVISWTHSTITTDKGKVLLEFGIDMTETSKLLERIFQYENDIEKIIDQRLLESKQELTSLTNLTSESGMLIVGADKNGIVLFVNKNIEELTGWKSRDLLHHSLFTSLIAEKDREQVEFVIQTTQNESLQPHHASFPVTTKDGVRIFCRWQNVSTLENEKKEKQSCFFGFVDTKHQEVYSQIEHRHVVLSTHEAKLSQRYRFLMKYVPFPLLHLDENDMIVNANPAFQELVGLNITYGTPVRDFASYEVIGSNIDPAPCNVYILNKDGLTITHRGFITTLSIYGKTIREITIDVQ